MKRWIYVAGAAPDDNPVQQEMEYTKMNIFKALNDPACPEGPICAIASGLRTCKFDVEPKVHKDYVLDANSTKLCKNLQFLFRVWLCFYYLHAIYPQAGMPDHFMYEDVLIDALKAMRSHLLGRLEAIKHNVIEMGFSVNWKAISCFFLEYCMYDGSDNLNKPTHMVHRTSRARVGHSFEL